MLDYKKRWDMMRGMKGNACVVYMAAAPAPQSGNIGPELIEFGKMLLGSLRWRSRVLDEKKRGYAFMSWM